MAVRTTKLTTAPARSIGSTLSARSRSILAGGTLTMAAMMLVVVYLLPLAAAATTAIKPRYNDPGTPQWPAAPATYTYQGEEVSIYKVPTENGLAEWALVKKGREQSTFIDPANPDTPIQWQGRWRTLEQVWNFKLEWNNFRDAWEQSKFPRLFVNTFAIAIIGAFGTVISSVCVAYGFSRFPIPGKNIVFLVLIATIILPPQVTLIPTYTLYTKIGWTGTWLPLIVPHFFANAYNVFLLRQFFMGIPRDLDEAAMLDGASPFRTLISIILPQALPAVIAVSLFHFFWSWNDFFGPLIYLVGKPELWPISVGIQKFNEQFSQQPNLVQASMLMAIVVPLAIFFVAQRFFMQGVVVTGVEK